MATDAGSLDGALGSVPPRLQHDAILVRVGCPTSRSSTVGHSLRFAPAVVPAAILEGQHGSLYPKHNSWCLVLVLVHY